MNKCRQKQVFAVLFMYVDIFLKRSLEVEKDLLLVPVAYIRVIPQNVSTCSIQAS